MRDDESDSSDNALPPTPRKDRLLVPPTSANAKKQALSGALRIQSPNASPLTSPIKQEARVAVLPSPKKTLFSRPKLNLKEKTRENMPSEEEPVTPSYFQDSSAPSTFSSFLKSAGNHVSHPLHGSRQPTPGANGVRGRSLDLLRGDQGQNSPSFFSAARQVSQAERLSETTDDTWSLLCARVLPLFCGEGLRQPVEDLNRLVSTYLRYCIDNKEQSHLVEDLVELFETGTASLDNNLAAMNDEKLIHRLVEIWVFYFSSVLPYLEATFLPLTVEFSSNASPYLADSGNVDSLSIHLLALQAYRDVIVLPLKTRLAGLLQQLPFLVNVSGSADDASETFSRMLQCISILRRVQSGDKSQECMDELGKAVLIRRVKNRGDRRGFVAGKKIVVDDTPV
ncbi:HbrB-like-domain-containing protein [Protomyces lactucae-debilis]|uniref:HbrB-like-domain-containing protein n=1 Tax=Protomyces lactucae-debilis TaxID=2754530 RepID=A0A1Y2F2V5_PROLT|nr:HbrB-like-domain-containing protein [Protomyces lactucae-debilis]ORY78228.1 HbrB-like-domain-containing protein [Protomyces lactucae-debilis]